MTRVAAAVLLCAACGTSGASSADAGYDHFKLTNTDASRDATKLPGPDAGVAVGASVLEHHLHGSRDGAYVDARVTKSAAAKVVIDPGFHATVTGTLYGQPLYVDGGKAGKDALIVATNQNHVTALDATSGATLWDRVLGPPVALKSLPCGGPYDPYGVSDTPVIDLATRTLYAESFQTPDGGTTKKHYIYALSIDDGSTRAGWPVDVAAKVSGFDPTVQHDRGALALVQGTVYVPYAGLNGDCGSYHGWVVAVSTSDPTKVGAFATPADKGGIWGSMTTDGVSAFAVTGNTTGAAGSWGGGEALLRFTGLAHFSGSSTDYFTPSNWQSLDDSDSDLGSSGSVFFDLPGATPSTLAVAMGKAGVIHLLDRGDLGGVGKGDGQRGEGLFSLGVGGQMKGISATYTTAKGRYVVARCDSAVSVCPGGTSGDLLALRVTPSSPPTLVPAWCASSQGTGAPIATTSDGTSDGLVWIVSALGTDRLLSFDGDTGAAVYTGGGADEQLGTIQHWTSPIVAKGRFFVGGTGAVYALKTNGS